MRLVIERGNLSCEGQLQPRRRVDLLKRGANVLDIRFGGGAASQRIASQNEKNLAGLSIVRDSLIYNPEHPVDLARGRFDSPLGHSRTCELLRVRGIAQQVGILRAVASNRLVVHAVLAHVDATFPSALQRVFHAQGHAADAVNA